MKSYFIERTCCPACESPETAPLYSAEFSSPPIATYLKEFYSAQGSGVEMEYLQGARYALSRCCQCGLIYQAWIGNDELFEQLYSVWIDPVTVFQKFHTGHSILHYQSLARQILLLSRRFKPIANDQLQFLDFGMGWGEWCRMASGFGIQTFGCELSPSRIEHARRYGIEIVDYEEIPDRGFHVINAEQVFEHVPKPLEMLRHLAKGLLDGGIIHIAVPDGRRVPDLLKAPNWAAPKGSSKSLNAVAPLEHINCFTHENLVRMAEQAGLRQIRFGILAQYEVSINIKPFVGLAKTLLIPWYSNYLDRTNLWFTRK